MEEENHLPSCSMKKKFGHCKVYWQIDNFCLQTCGKDWVIRSPEFTVKGSEDTKWCMILLPKSNVKNNLISFNLKRCIFDEGPEVVWVDLRLYFWSSDNKHIHINDKLFSLRKGSVYEKSLRRFEWFAKMKTFESDLLTVVCKMIVYNEDASENFKECADVGIKFLSENMLNLYMSGQNYDTKLIIGNNVIPTHQTVLYARNEQLRILIGYEDDSIEDVEFEEHRIIEFRFMLDYRGMKKILAYLYSGDSKHVLGEPSHAIHDCARILEINEIEDYYKSDKLALRSSIDIQQFTFVLVTTAFNWEYEEYGFNIDFNTDNPVTMYQIHFYRRSQQSSECSSLFTETFEGNAPMNIFFEIATVDQFDHYLSTAVFFNSVKDQEHIKINDIMRRNSMKPHLTAGVLKLVIKLRLSTLAKNSSIDKESISVITCHDEDFCYKLLSMDMEYMFDGGPFSDVLINNDGVYFWVHKCIVASRSRFFYEALRENEDGQIVVIPDIETHILPVLLTYIYAGVLIDTDDDNLIKVYKAAVTLRLPLLKAICSGKLIVCSTTNVNIRCRAIKIAEENEDQVLKKCVISHLYNSVIPLPAPNQSFSFRDVHTCRYC